MNNNAQHCLTALLWSETDDDDEPLDSGKHEPSSELIATVEAQWAMFAAMLDSVGFDPGDQLAMMLHPDCDGDPWNAVAHDFILTRNGHGVGFWDTGRWREPWATRLCQLCKRFGSLETYVGDDGLIYC